MKIKSFWLLVLLSGVAVTQAAPAKAVLPAKAKAAPNTNQPYRLPPVGIEGELAAQRQKTNEK
jgi:hypothetical protein